MKQLSESKGKNVLYKILEDGISKEQARAAITTFCILSDYEVDTANWDILIWDIWKHHNYWFNTIEEMDNYFAELLV